MRYNLVVSRHQVYSDAILISELELEWVLIFAAKFDQN